MAHRRLRREEYTVGWVCALPIELATAQAMLDEKHESFQPNASNTNIYMLGRVEEHNIVITYLPEGQTDTNSAAVITI